MKNSDYSVSLQVIVQEIIDEGKTSPRQGVELRMIQSTLDYLLAIEATIESGKCERLDRLLKSQVPIHPKLLPALSDCLKTIQHGTQVGRPSAFTPTQEEIIYEILGHNKSAAKSTITEEIAALAFELDVSESTVKRVWDRFQKQQKEQKVQNPPSF
jgi:hypothetical protein